MQETAPLPTQSQCIMTITETSRPFRLGQFQMSFRSDTPSASFDSHVPVRQTPSSAMPSPALLVPSKQEDLPPETLEDHERFFDAVGDPVSGASDFSFMNYNFPSQPTDFSNYQIAASPQTSDLLPALNYGPQLRMATQQPYADPCPRQYSSPGFDRNCPRTLTGFTPGNLSNIYFPASYQFAPAQQSFCIPDHIYQEPSVQMEEAFSGLSTQDDPQDMDTSVYPSPASQCLHYDDSPSYDHPKQEFGRPLRGEHKGFGNGQDDASSEKDEPYSKLIYRALMEKPDHTMVLRDIYEWFKLNTDKTDKVTKGWQNSIRHNLSMNGAFDKVEQPPGEDAKKGNMWRLTDEAIRDGVKSTTRFRKNGKHRSKYSHGQAQHPPAAQRQAAGSKGGQAARRSTQRQQQQQQRRQQQQHEQEQEYLQRIRKQQEMLEQLREEQEQQRKSERELFECGLGMRSDRPLDPETDPTPAQYMLDPIPGEPHTPHHWHGLPVTSDCWQHLANRPNQYQQIQQHSEPASSTLSPCNMADYQPFPQSPAEDQSWSFNTMSDAPASFAPAAAPGHCVSESLNVAGLVLTPSGSPSLSDGDDPPTPINNPGGLDVDPDGHLAPPPRTTFFEAEGATM